jgi:hypothetical protein
VQGFLKGAVVGGIGAAAVLAAGAALAGSGIGGVFNLGQSNTVDNATTKLSGTNAGSMLDVGNTNTASAAANGIFGHAASATASGVVGIGTAGTGLRGTSTSGYGGRLISTTGDALYATSHGSKPTIRATNTSTGPAAAFETGAGTAPFTVTSGTKVAGLNADSVDGFDAAALLRLPETLPAGQTIRGTYGARSTCDSTTQADCVEAQGISWGIQLSALPTTHLILDGGSVPAGCSGSLTNPGADPGHLCVFEGFSFNAANPFLCNPSAQGCLTTFGTVMLMAAAGTGLWDSFGTWAVTGS